MDFSMSQGNETTTTGGHWCAVLNTGVVKCAGTGNYGQLGNGASSNLDWINGAVTVSGISNAIKIYTASAGYSTNLGYSCALLTDGGLKCWGYFRNGVGQTNVPVSTFG